MTGASIETSGGQKFPSFAAFLAFLVALAICIAAAIAYYLNPSAEEPPTAALPQPPGPSVSAAAQNPLPLQDPTQSFFDFAMVGQKFAPEWLARTKKVYWTDSGALWANAEMPRNPPERIMTIERICLKLSEYVTDVAKRTWAGVSVRAVDGTELFTRANPTDTCRPAS